MRIHPEILDPPQLLHFLRRAQELGHVPKVLCDGPEDLAGVDVGMVPLQQVPRRGNVLGNRFLGQHMLSCCQGLADEIRLDQDGETARRLISQ